MHTIQYNTIQYNTIQYNTIQYNTIQYNTIQDKTRQDKTRQDKTRQDNTIQYNTIQYNTIQYNTIQYNTIQYNTIQYNTIKLYFPGPENSFPQLIYSPSIFIGYFIITIIIIKLDKDTNNKHINDEKRECDLYYYTIFTYIAQTRAHVHAYACMKIYIIAMKIHSRCH